MAEGEKHDDDSWSGAEQGTDAQRNVAEGGGVAVAAAATAARGGNRDSII